MNHQTNFNWKGKTFAQVTSRIQRNKGTHNNIFSPNPLKIYRQEITSCFALVEMIQEESDVTNLQHTCQAAARVRSSSGIIQNILQNDGIVKTPYCTSSRGIMDRKKKAHELPEYNRGTVESGDYTTRTKYNAITNYGMNLRTPDNVNISHNLAYHIPAGGYMKKAWNQDFPNPHCLRSLTCLPRIIPPTPIPKITYPTIAGGTGINTLAYSQDGIHWTGLGNPVFSTNVFGVAYNGSRWVAVGEGGNTIAYSDNGTYWTGIGNDVFSSVGYGVVWNGTVWMAVGKGTGNTIAYSFNGTDWTGVTQSKIIFSTNVFGVAYNGNRWVAVGEGGNSIAYSDNGTDWTGVGNNVLDYFGNCVAWNGSLWVAVGAGTEHTIAYSSNGTDWTGVTQSKTIFSDVGAGVAWNGSRWVAVGYGTEHTIAYSDNGTDWTGAGRTMFSFGVGVAWNGTLWMAAGEGTFDNESNSLAYSYDGIHWTGLGRSIFDIGKSFGTNKVLPIITPPPPPPFIFDERDTLFCAYGFDERTSNGHVYNQVNQLYDARFAKGKLDTDTNMWKYTNISDIIFINSNSINRKIGIGALKIIISKATKQCILRKSLPYGINGFSVCFWVKLPSSTYIKTNPLFMNGSSYADGSISSTQGPFFEIRHNEVRTVSADMSSISSITYSPKLGTLTHITVTMTYAPPNSITSNCIVYINGLIRANNPNNYYPSTSFNDICKIGTSDTTFVTRENDIYYMDDFRWYNKVLGSNEIKYIMNNTTLYSENPI